MRRFDEAPPAPMFELLTRKGCHLCDEMKTVLDDELAALGGTYVLVDVDTDPALCERFGDTVPVLMRDGKPVAKVRIDAAKLRRLVRRRR